MNGSSNDRRNATALVISALLHVAILTFLVTRAAPQYAIPEPAVVPAEVEIVTMPTIIPPPPPIVPPVVPPKPQIVPTPPPAPAPPIPQPPAPAPPSPPKPVPQPKPAPPKPTPPKVTPLPAPVAPLAPPMQAAPVTPAARTTPKPATPAPPASAAPSPTATPARLNIHKSAREAPANVPTLPMAPSPAAAGRPGAAAAGSPAAPAGSRLSGLNPYPYGAMPSGGAGLRGTLVGCANADAVRLSSIERAHCNERFGAEAAGAPTLDGISPAKRAAFDRENERQDYIRKRSSALGLSKDDLTSPAGPMNPPGVVTGPASSFSH